MAGKLNLIPYIVIALPVCSQRPTPGVPEFESSAFCRKYRCVQSGAIEPVVYSCAVKEYIYSYRASIPEALFIMRLSAGGKRTNPYLTVRWIAPSPIAEKDLVGIEELVAEITGAKNFDAAKLVLEFSASKPNPSAGPVARVGNFEVWCAYTPPKNPHIELVIGMDHGATVEMGIGAATMLPDGTIVLNLRAEGAGGAIGDGRISYPKSHPDYPDILSHLGGLRPGEHKPVPPWPDH